MSLLIAGSQYFPEDVPTPVVTIGNFDGVHLGHQKLLKRAIEEARQNQLPSCVYTFEPSPRSLLSPNRSVPRIVSWDEKIALLFELGVDIVVIEPFTKAFAQISPQFFIDEILSRRLRAKSLVVGYDFRFGRARAGTADLIRQHRPELDVIQISALKVKKEEIISSTVIRQLIEAGDVAKAAQYLSRPHVVCGVVVSGDQRGRTIGFPTANVLSSTPLIPAMGVYAASVQVNQRHHQKAIVNLGTRPTFDGTNFAIEVHIFDFNEDIYGQQLRVFFHERIRAEKQFNGATALKAQLQKDIAQTVKILDSIEWFKLLS
ncbi:MAG: bifunctional riboflavin kinase/FAD synthetase [Myxococcota bacterium]|nr:bifunctional riboflavin kinase/FAD synthetase [Myxococcota bacterium]